MRRFWEDVDTRKRIFCGHINRPHLSQFWKKVIFAIQLSHFLLMHLPYKAFQLELPEMNCHIFVKLNVVKTFLILNTYIPEFSEPQNPENV